MFLRNSTAFATAVCYYVKLIRGIVTIRWTSFGKPHKAMNSGVVTKKCAQPILLPVMRCVAETWLITEHLDGKLMSSQRATEGRVIGVMLLRGGK